jgi:uncharacterized membrane protein
VKTAFCWLAAGFAIGAIMLVLKALGKPVPAIFIIEHEHIIFVGWLVNMVVGFALWMLPVNRQAFPRTAGRAPESMHMLVYVLLNLGLLLRLVDEPWLDLNGISPIGSLLLIGSAVAQLSAILLLIPLVWARVRPPGATRARTP